MTQLMTQIQLLLMLFWVHHLSLGNTFLGMLIFEQCLFSSHANFRAMLLFEPVLSYERQNVKLEATEILCHSVHWFYLSSHLKLKKSLHCAEYRTFSLILKMFEPIIFTKTL